MANNIVRWEPFGEMLSLRDAVNRLFEDSFIRPGLWPMSTDGGQMGLAVDIIETKDDVVVKASVPGIKPDDLDISIAGDLLTIKGEVKAAEKIEKGSYIRQERRYGAFERTLSLPTSVVADQARAEFEHGVLTLTLPKAEEVKPRSIKVKAK